MGVVQLGVVQMGLVQLTPQSKQGVVQLGVVKLGVVQLGSVQMGVDHSTGGRSMTASGNKKYGLVETAEQELQKILTY